MFAAADLMLLNKCDLLPHLDFDADLCEANARRVNPAIQVLRVSATKGEGIERWLAWLQGAARESRARRIRSAAVMGCGGAGACTCGSGPQA
jgi:hydrogenase nickel incorporation protein HypB